jgi:hypothetical protein
VRDETEVRPLVADPCLIDLQHATVARVRRLRHVPVESWLPAQRDPAAADLFSTRIHESFFQAHMSAQIALRAHRLLDLPAFLLAASADSEVHLSYLPWLLTLLTTSGRFVEEWARVFYASVWIDLDHQWMRFRFERDDVTIHASQIRHLFGFTESSTRFTSCATVPLILLVALTAVLLQLHPTSRPCSDRLSQMGRDALRQISLQWPSTYISS